MRRPAGRPRPHLPSVAGRARADRGSLLLAGLVVALATLAAAAVPPAMGDTADHAVADAVDRAGADADVVVDAPLEPDEDWTGNRTRDPLSAEELRRWAGVAQLRLGDDAAAALSPPVGRVASDVLEVTSGDVPRRLQLAFVAVGGPQDGGQAPRVVWTAGGPPRGAVAASDRVTLDRTDPAPWPVQVGLSEENAAALGVGPGALLQVRDSRRQAKDVRVSGVFRAADPGDPAWRQTPALLRPVPGADGPATVRSAALLSVDSLPDARLAFDPEGMRATVTFLPRPDRLTWSDADRLAATVVALKASSGASGEVGELRWQSGIDGVLREVRTRVTAAAAQALVLLVGVLTVAGLVLVLAADLLVRRRAGALAGARERGASLPGVGLELLLESAAVAVAGAVTGVVVAAVLAGDAAWRWALPVVIVAALAGPVLGMRTAGRATRAVRVPANRSARRALRRTTQLRRVTLEGAVLVAAAGALVALRQRGIVPAGPDAPDPGAGGGALPTLPVLPALAPTLLAVTGALALLRLLPPGLGVALRRAVRSRGGLVLVGTARAVATAARPVVFAVLVTSVALLSFAVTLSATVTRGQADGAWRAVGGDARVDAGPGVSAADVARSATRAAGVRQAVAARVADDVTVHSDDGLGHVRLVVVDAAAFRRLLAETPLPDAPAPDRLAPGRAAAGRVPALVRWPGGPVPGGLTLRWTGGPLPVTVGLDVAGTAPAVGEGEGAVVVVDATAFARAAGAEAVPGTVWLTGPGAGAAATALAGTGTATSRADVLEARRSSPPAAGLLRLTFASAAALVLLGLLGVVLGAAATAPSRAETLARLRTLGLSPRETRQVAVGELVPPVAFAAAGGLVLGILLTRLSLGPLGLRLLTGQAADPAVVVPWAVVVPAAALPVLAVTAVALTESRRSTRTHLASTLRASTT